MGITVFSSDRHKGHKVLLAAIDALLINLVLITALWLRFEGAVPDQWWTVYPHAVLWLTAPALLLNWTLGLYNRVWRYARSEATIWILVAVSLAVAIGWFGFRHTTGGLFSISISAMTWAFALIAIGGSRFAWRQMYWMAQRKSNGSNGERERMIVYGAGHTGASFADQLDTCSDDHYLICGFVDDDPTLKGMIVAGHRVLGEGEDLPQLVSALNIDKVILAAPSASGETRRRMFSHASASGAEVRTLPRMLETVTGEASKHDVRHVLYNDLLGRDMNDMDLELDPNYVEGKSVLITGAGGSIGSEICRQLCRYRPANLILLGRGENRIHAITRELQSGWPEIECTPVICNFTNAEHVEQVFEEYQPQVVFHAGAHKHVYLMEMHPTEAVRNNVLGTGVLARAADRAGVERFVAISTDKAVEPCNVMGASKRLCELLIKQINRESMTRFMAVRFGNVIGSSGSVLKIFEQQAASGAPLTVTHPEATRFFMTVEEAAFLVLHAGALGDGGEIFVLEMGEPVCIYNMAREFLQMHGRDPDEPGAIRITSLNPGEKVHEALCSSCEELEPTVSHRINRVGRNGHEAGSITFDAMLTRARVAARDRAAAEDLLAEVCPNPGPLKRWPVATGAAGG